MMSKNPALFVLSTVILVTDTVKVLSNVVTVLAATLEYLLSVRSLCDRRVLNTAAIICLISARNNYYHSVLSTYELNNNIGVKLMAVHL